MKKEWMTGPAAFVAMLAGLLVTWAIVEPAALVKAFDNSGYSPFELATLPFFAAIVPLVWWKCPFEGSKTRRTILCAAVSLVAIMAIAKETDLHITALRLFYPDYINDTNGLAPGLFKPNGQQLTGTPFKMRVLTNAGVPLGMKMLIICYFVSFFGVFGAGLVYFLPKFIKGAFTLDAASWAFGCCGASGVLVQISDRLPAWLDHSYGLNKHSETISYATSLCTCLEEGGEMMLAVMALITIALGAARLKQNAPSNTDSL